MTLLRMLLWPASLLFYAMAWLRAWGYRRGIFKQQHLNGVVISVGNLTVGGTGKTPLVIWIAEHLHAGGERVGILTRGYRGTRRPGEHGVVQSDEVALLRARLGKKAQLGVGADRYATGQVLERHGVEWFVLDDGFQHLQLARDVDIVLLDAIDPFGGGHLLPAGWLREPKSALSRADLVVISRTEHAPAVEAVVQRHTSAPIFYAQTRFEGIFPLHRDGALPQPVEWRGKKFFAFCGIGNPAAFAEDLRRWGMQISGSAVYRDHHRYSARDALEIERRAQTAGAEALLGTEKDVFNLDASNFPLLPVFFCRIALEIFEAQNFWQAVGEMALRKRYVARR